VLARPFGSQNLAVSPTLLPLIAAPSMPPQLVHAECAELAAQEVRCHYMTGRFPWI
jgi:hypothetical protein